MSIVSHSLLEAKYGGTLVSLDAQVQFTLRSTGVGSFLQQNIQIVQEVFGLSGLFPALLGTGRLLFSSGATSKMRVPEADRAMCFLRLYRPVEVLPCCFPSIGLLGAGCRRGPLI